MANRPLPSPEVLRQLLRYEPETGRLFWLPRPREMFGDERTFKIWNKKNAGKLAFTAQNGSGYFVGSLVGRTPRAHRVAWAIYYGEWPASEIDHKNCNGLDNRIDNLRLATSGQNKHNQRIKENNTSGHKGVSWAKREKLWRSYASVGGKQKCFGYFPRIEDAAAARAAGIESLHGEFARVK